MATLRAQVENCLAFMKARRDNAPAVWLRLLLDDKVTQIEDILAEMPQDQPPIVRRLARY